MPGCEPRRVAGFVLAGGRSSRMGTDKAGLLWNGKSLLVHAVNVIRAVAGTVTIVGDPSIHSVDLVPVISDRIQGAGPVAGIEAALASSEACWNLVVACDMPMLQADVLTAILDRAYRRPECDAVIPFSNGRPQPLCAAYHLRALPVLRTALDAGTFKIIEALKDTRVGRIEIAEGASFRNVNTPEDWETLVLEKPV